MRIFYAGASRGRAALLISLGVRNFLVSYESPKAVEEGATVLSELPFSTGAAMIVDSGAFSAWNSGRTINLKEYISYAQDFIRRYKDKIPHIFIVNLDVIPGEQGRLPSVKETEDAARQGWENMIAFEKAGITPVHIFHQGENFKWLKQIAARHRYIGISPSNDASTKSKFEWMRAVFGQIKANNMTHGFAVTSKKLMETFPFYSVDSTSWMAAELWGKPIFSRSFDAMNLHSRIKSHTAYVLRENIKNLLQLEKKYTALWAARKVVWDDRAD